MPNVSLTDPLSIRMGPSGPKAARSPSARWKLDSQMRNSHTTWLTQRGRQQCHGVPDMGGDRGAGRETPSPEPKAAPRCSLARVRLEVYGSGAFTLCNKLILKDLLAAHYG